MSGNLVKISTLAGMAGVPTATVKHYMREGLLPEPELRTSRNMAYYDPALADRIRSIKQLQQKRFLPLKVIRAILEPAPSAAIRSDLDEVQRRRLGGLVPLLRARYDQPEAPAAEGPRRLSRSQVLERLDLSAADLDELAAMELIAAEPGQAEPVYAGSSLELLRIIDETRRLGLGPLFPIAILAPYAAGLREFVRLELELFRQQILEHPPGDAAELSRVSDQVLRLSSRLVGTLRDQLIVAEVDRMQARGQQPAPERDTAEPASGRPQGGDGQGGASGGPEGISG